MTLANDGLPFSELAGWYNEEQAAAEQSRQELADKIAGLSEEQVANDPDIRQLAGEVKGAHAVLASFAAFVTTHAADQKGEFDSLPETPPQA